MDKRWRNLEILIVVIAVAISALFFLQAPRTSPVNFDSGLSELNQVWSEEDIEPYISEDDLVRIPKEKINSLKAKTIAFKEKIAGSTTREGKALYSLADVYIARLDLLLAVKESMEANEVYTFAGNEAVDTQEIDVCNRIPVLENMHEKLKLVLQNLKSFESKLQTFSDQYPEFLEKTEFVPNPEKISEIEVTIERNTELIAELKVGCQ